MYGGGGNKYGTPPRGVGGATKKVKALFDYYGDNPTDLSFKQGDVITIISEQASSGPDWWQGEIRGVRGSFPLNHVEVLQDAIRSYDNNIPMVPMSSYSPPQATSYNTPSYSTPSYTAPSYSTPSYSPSSSSTTPINNTPEPKPAKTASSFSGGGGDNSTRARYSMILGAFALLSAFLGMVFPWYYVSIKNSTVILQWDGAASVPTLPASSLISSSLRSDAAIVKSWTLLGWSDVKTTMILALTFLIIGWIAICIHLFFLNIVRRSASFRGNEFNSRILFLIGVAAFLLTFLSILLFFGIGASYQKNTGVATVGPATSFSGSSTDGSWGPCLGWIFALVASIFAFSQLIPGYLMVREDGGFFP